MASETIMLAKKFDVRKVQFPCAVTEKLDGVAADFYCNGNFGEVLVRSRQNKPILSVAHIQEWLTGKLQPGAHVICELYVPGMPFKDIGGLVRAHDPAPVLQAFCYDFYIEGQENTEFSGRCIQATRQLCPWINDPTAPVKFIKAHVCESAEELLEYLFFFKELKPNAEGVVIRSLYGAESYYKFGRSWGMQKCKTQETADLKVIGFEEARTEDGKPKGMVGRIWVECEALDYPGTTIQTGAGAGKMTHEERTEVWNNQDKYIGKIAEIAYMPDETYAGGLREPRFYQWRNDKTEPSQE